MGGTKEETGGIGFFFIKDPPRLILIITTNHATSYQCFFRDNIGQWPMAFALVWCWVGGDWHLKYGWLNIVIAIVSHQIVFLSVGRSGNYIRCYFCGNLNIGGICHVGCKIEIWCCTCVRVANLCNLTNSASCRRLVSSTQLAENVSVSNLWPRNNQPDNMWSLFFLPDTIAKSQI